MGQVSWTVSYVISEQQRRRSACASAQSDQHLCFAAKIVWDVFLLYPDISLLYLESFKILASLCSWVGWFESYLVKNHRRHILEWCGSCVHTYMFQVGVDPHFKEWGTTGLLSVVSTSIVNSKEYNSSVILRMAVKSSNKWAATWQNQQSDCAPSEDSDQPGHPPSLIRVFAVRSMGS